MIDGINQKDIIASLSLPALSNTAMGPPKGNSRNVLDIRMGNESMNGGFSVVMFDYQRVTDEINRISLAISGIYPYLSWFGRCNTLSLSISYDCED